MTGGSPTARAARLRTVVRLTPSFARNAYSDGSGSPSPSSAMRSTASLKARLNTVSVFMRAISLP